MSSAKKNNVVLTEITHTTSTELELDDSVITLDDTTDQIIELDEDDSFIDTLQCEEHENGAYLEPKESSTLDISNTVSNLYTPEVKNEGSKGRRSNTQCFNCLGDHPLYKCTEKHDKQKISRNRNNFMLSKKPRDGFGNMGGRFHEESVRFKPGLISDDLRDALGIGERQMPPWIFRMRKKGFINGYPPAYKKSAVESNVLKFITNSGSEDIVEVDGDTTPENQLTLDIEKMIKYPGFNFEDRRLVDPEKGSYRIPPWNLYLDAFRKHINQRNERIQMRRSFRSFSPPGSSQKPSQLTEHGTLNLSVELVDVTNSTLEEGELVELNASSDSFSMQENVDVETSMQENIEIDVEKKQLEPGESELEPEEPESSVHMNGTSSPMVISIPGTPIPLRKHISQDKYNHEVDKPKLDNWAEGIQPFTHQAEIKSEKTGFFKKMHSIMRKVITKKIPPSK